jgi:hypothetical protein
LENGKLLLECDVLALAGASKRREEMIGFCCPFFFSSVMFRLEHYLYSLLSFG